MNSKFLSTSLPIAGGYVAGNFLANKIGFVRDNPLLRAVAPIGGAMAIQMFFGRKAEGIATGMLVSGAVNGVKAMLPDVANTVGLSGVPYKSTFLPGVSGTARLQQAYPPVVVQ